MRNILLRVKSVDETVKSIYIKISRPFKSAFMSALIFGLIAHLYMFMNKLPNHDDMGLNGFGVTFRLGRWFLWFLGAAAYHLDFVYSLPWVNGLITLVFIALSAGFTADMLNVKSISGNVLIGAAMAVYPSWTATFFFMFTAPYYAVALFLAVLSVYITVKNARYFIVGVLLMACSMGIYQAYITFAAALYVIVLILMVADGENDFLRIIKSSFYYLGQLVLCGVAYFIITKLSLAVTNQRLADYKGINAMGSFSSLHFSELAKIIFRDFFGLGFNNNLELSYNYAVKFMYFSLFIITGVFIALFIKHFMDGRQYLKACEMAVLSAVFVIAANSIYIACAEVYALMRYSYVSLIILPICIIDRYKKSEMTQCLKNNVLWAEWVMTFVMAAGIASYCHFANAQYLSLKLGFEQAQVYYGTVVTQIKALDGYEPEMKTALIGYNHIEDKSLYRNQIMEVFDMSGRTKVLAESFSIEYFLRYYCGFDTQLVEIDVNDSEVAQMPVYPAMGSIKIVDNIVVVKFSD